MTDAYDLFVMGMVLVIVNQLYPSPDKGLATTTISWTVLAGATVGQLLFGLSGDRIGRKKMFVITLSLIIIFALSSAFSFKIAGHIWISLCIFRFFLGVGIGGEYPLSATIAAEGSEDPKTRGCRMASVFSMQGIGNLLAPSVVLLLLAIFPFEKLDLVWRLALGFGAIPCLLTAYHRYKLEESPHYKHAKESMPSWAEVRPIMWEYKWNLVGTAGTWFLFDVTFYGNGLFKETVIKILGLAEGTGRTQLINTALASLIISSIALPGYYLAIPVVDRIGRKPMQLFGFAAMTITFLIMGITFHQLTKIPTLFIIVYGLTFFFSNFGPNTTTFIIPGEVFPTQVRATCHGISAAAGKLGAILGVAGFQPLYLATSYSFTFYVCAGVAAAGFVLTILFVPEKSGQSLEEVNPSDMGVGGVNSVGYSRIADSSS